MIQRNIVQLQIKQERLTGTGFMAPIRSMMFYKRKPATVTVFVARQGEDLYISWRAFMQGKISWTKVVLILIICLALAPLSSYGQYFSGEWHINSKTAVANFFALVVMSSVVIAVFGVFFRRGDYLALIRSPLHELHYDDVNSLSSAVHSSLLASADGVGIDITKVKPREPVFQTRRKPRI